MRWLIALFAFLTSAWATAEPTTVTRYLMAEPVSVMDFGLYQMSKHLSADERSFPGISQPASVIASAVYDWDTNRISVALWINTYEKTLSASTAKEICRRAVGHSRALSGVNALTGEVSEGAGTAAHWFQSPSYQKKSAPANLEREVMAIIEFTATVFPEIGPQGAKPAATCSGRLLSSDVLFKE